MASEVTVEQALARANSGVRWRPERSPTRDMDRTKSHMDLSVLALRQTKHTSAPQPGQS